MHFIDQKPLIISEDDFREEIFPDSKTYVDALVNIIKYSIPKFSIGIFGNHGNEKSLIKLLKSKLFYDNDKKLITVWFAASRYNQEDQYGNIALINTIAQSLPEDKPFYDLKKRLKRINPGIVSKLAKDSISKSVGDLSKSTLEEFEKHANLLKEIDNNYYDGIDQIHDVLRSIRLHDPELRLVVFIVDLDNCTQKKVSEILNSLKIFNEIEGFIFVIALGNAFITKYNSEIEIKENLNDIIEIPIVLPEAKVHDTIQMIEILSKYTSEDYAQFILQNKEIIRLAVEYNFKSIRRFINKFIISSEIYSSPKDIDSKRLLIFQVLSTKWNHFYQYFIKYDNFRKLVEKYINLSNQERNKVFLELETKYFLPEDHHRIILTYKSDPDLWYLLTLSKNYIFNLNNFEIYQRVIFDNPWI